MSRVIVCALEELERRSAALSGCTGWVYLGKDLRRQGTAARLLRGKPLLALNGRLHEIAERLRQPFLDFIASLGRLQTDQLGWWSSSCSWKDVEVSSLFLLICYGHLVGALLREDEAGGGQLAVVIEDPWLFYQVKEVCREKPGVQCYGAPLLWPARARMFVRGIGARALWVTRLAGNYLRQRWRWKAGSLQVHTKPVVALYSHPLTRCLKGTDGWADPCLGNLDDLLEEDGYAVCRFSPPDVGGLEKELRRRSRYFRPLILFATARSLLRSIFASWRPVWPVVPVIGGLPVAWLLRREWHLDRWRSSYLHFRFFFECLSRMLAAEPVALLIYPHENQPWERMLILAARAHGVPTIGYQHGGGLARFMLPYFHGSTEAEFAPLPDRIITSGPYSHELLAAGGAPLDRLIMGGSLRYQHLRKDAASGMDFSSASPVRILVSLPVERDLGLHLVHALRRAFPDGGRAAGVEFFVKPHPWCPMTVEALGWPVAVVEGSFEEAIRPCAILIYTGTTTGLEALAMGRRVIRYRPELLLDMDRGEFLVEEGLGIVTCGDSDIGEKLQVVIKTLDSPSTNPNDVGKLFDRVFAPVKREVWLETVGRLCRARV